MPNIDISEIAGGAVAEAAGIELQKVIENIADANTDPKKVREVTIKIKVRGDERRDIAMVEVQTNSKLIPSKPLETKFIIDRDSKGKVVGAELVSGTKDQMMIDNEGDLADDRGQKIQAENKVVNLRSQN